ncbi:MAG: (d)CMP kinase [Crocinitomicaceae bacterium]
MAKKITIAIDGYSSCGKSTIAKEIAQKLDYIYVDSGAMYRSVCLYLMNEGIIKDKRFLESQVQSVLPLISITFKVNNFGQSETYLNGENVEDEIRTIEVSNLVSQVSTIGSVRKKLVAMQQKMGIQGGVVMDGRDIGTVVFPMAELKLFMTADVDVRAERRLKELVEKGQLLTFAEVKANLQHRDHVDKNRDISPLKQANDAIVIDNTNLSAEEQLEKVLSLVNSRLSRTD